VLSPDDLPVASLQADWVLLEGADWVLDDSHSAQDDWRVESLRADWVPLRVADLVPDDSHSAPDDYSAVPGSAGSSQPDAHWPREHFPDDCPVDWRQVGRVERRYPVDCRDAPWSG
jgi:hypothetical protein